MPNEAERISALVVLIPERERQMMKVHERIKKIISKCVKYYQRHKNPEATDSDGGGEGAANRGFSCIWRP